MSGLSRRNLLALLAAPAVAQRREDVNVHEELLTAARDAPLRMQFQGDSPDDATRWQRTFRTKLAALLGPHRPPEQWRTVVEEEAEHEGYLRRSLLLEADGVFTLPLHLLIPTRNANGAGVVALHGHGPFGYDAVAGLDHTPERREDIETFRYDYGRQLARRGYVVACPCFQPFGRRLDSKEAYGGGDACAVSFVRMQLLGKVLLAENLRDALWAFEFLRSRDDVDEARIGCVGLSYGGRMTMVTSAMEPRIRVAVPSGALNVMQERMRFRYSCGAQVIPGLLEYGDVPEIGGLIAPRPAMWQIGDNDGLIVKDWVDPAWRRIRAPYEAYAASDALVLDRFAGAHQWNGEAAYPFLDATLR